MVGYSYSPFYEAISPVPGVAFGAMAEDINSTTTLPLLRSVLEPNIASLPHGQLVEFMEAEYGEDSAELYEAYLEGFFGDVGKFIKKAAPVVTNIAGGVVKGAATGSALGLPGIIGGAVMGGVGQGFASYGGKSLGGVGRTLNSGLNIAGQFSPMGRMGASAGNSIRAVGQGQNLMKVATSAATGLIPGVGALGGNNASQLLGLLRRPEVMQALGSLAMGRNGRTSIPVGSARTPVPASAFASLINQFAQSALDEQAAFADGSERDLSYLMNDAGEWIADPAESEERAAALYQLLNAAEYERLVEEDRQLRWLQEQAVYEQEMATAWELDLEAEWFAAGSGEDAGFGEFYGEWYDDVLA